MIRLTELLREATKNIIPELTDDEKQRMGVPAGATGKAGKWYDQQGNYIGKTVDGKYQSVAQDQGAQSTQSEPSEDDWSYDAIASSGQELANGNMDIKTFLKKHPDMEMEWQNYTDRARGGQKPASREELGSEFGKHVSDIYGKPTKSDQKKQDAVASSGQELADGTMDIKTFLTQHPEVKDEWKKWATDRVRGGQKPASREDLDSEFGEYIMSTHGTPNLPPNPFSRLNVREGTHGNIRLKNILTETHMKQSHINLMRVSTNLEKILPELTKAQATKLTDMMTELTISVTNLNSLPYTIFNADAWDIHIMATNTAINALKEEITKISEKKKDVNCAPLIKALDEVLTY